MNMKIRKTVYLSREAEEKLNIITRMENRSSNSNTMEYIIKQYKPIKI